jgi:hypothetical protein
VLRVTLKGVTLQDVGVPGIPLAGRRQFFDGRHDGTVMFRGINVVRRAVL